MKETLFHQVHVKSPLQVDRKCCVKADTRHAMTETGKMVRCSDTKKVFVEK